MSKINKKGWSKADAKKALHPYEQKHPYAFLEQDLKHHAKNPNKGSHADLVKPWGCLQIPARDIQSAVSARARLQSYSVKALHWEVELEWLCALDNALVAPK